jgi:hypothetical protein
MSPSRVPSKVMVGASDTASTASPGGTVSSLANPKSSTLTAPGVVPDRRAREGESDSN